MAAPPKFAMPILATRDETRMGGPLLICENLWPEEAAEGSDVPFTLHNPPGVEQILPLGAGTQLTALFQQDGIFNDEMFAFYNTTVRRIDRALNSTIVPGAGFSSNSTAGITKVAAIRGNMSWVDSNYTAWAYDGVTSAPVAGLPNTIGDVTALAKRFVWADFFTDTVYYSDLGASTFNALNFFTAETISDKLRAVFVHRDRLYLGGEETTEIYVPSPDFELPFAYTGVTLNLGSIGPGAWASTGPFCAMVGKHENSLGVFLIEGSSYSRISPNWLDRRLDDLSEVGRQQVLLQAYTIEGHQTLEISLPAGIDNVPAVTYAYDFKYGAWYLVTDPAGTGKRFWSKIGGSMIVGRADDGAIGIVSRNEMQYFGATLSRKWAVFQSTPKRVEQNEIVQQMNFLEPPALVGDPSNMVAAANINAAGGVLYASSDDMGVTFTPQRTVTVNQHPRYGHRVTRRRGRELRQPGRVHQFEVNYPCNYEIGPLMLNTETLIS